MDAPGQLLAARVLGEQLTDSCVALVRRRAHRQFRRTIGVTDDPPPPCSDASLAYFPPDSVTRRIHADLPSMLIGGLASLLFQALHPLAMAGVAQHSRYRADPLGRLERTARFVGTTTFGSREDAARAIRLVTAVHGRVEGTADDGRRYAATDPGLLTWVHAVEVFSFLSAAERYGAEPLDATERDAYVREMSRVALDLGATDVPLDVDALSSYLDTVRPELRFTPDARAARNFVLRGVGRWPHQTVPYGILVAAAQGLLPRWARRELRLLEVPAADRLVVRPAAGALCTTVRLLTPVSLN